MSPSFDRYITEHFVCAHCGKRAGNPEGPCDWQECAALSPLRVYVSGPMSGLPESNFPAFHAAAATLRAAGHEVVNPAEFPIKSGTGWNDCLRMDIAYLVTCDAIFMLDGWTASRGAQLEHHVALALGMTVIYP